MRFQRLGIQKRVSPTQLKRKTFDSIWQIAHTYKTNWLCCMAWKFMVIAKVWYFIFVHLNVNSNNNNSWLPQLVSGTPWQPEFCKWAFNVPRGAACLEKWNQIPANIDILISHTPPVGYGDLCSSNVRAGYVYRYCCSQLKQYDKKWFLFQVCWTTFDCSATSKTEVSCVWTRSWGV